MPTVLVLDTSLSMCRPVHLSDVSPEQQQQQFQYRNLAVHGLTSFLDYMSGNCKLEFAALMSFSSHRDTLVPFTRDFESIKGALVQLEYNERARLMKCLEGVQSLIMEEWGAGVPCQILLVTDGLIGPEVDSLKNDIANFYSSSADDSSSFPLPFPFPCKLHVLCVANPSSDTSLQAALPIYQKLVDIVGGQVFLPEGPLNFKNVQTMFLRVADQFYKPFHGLLHCGHLTSHISLSPPPETFQKTCDFDVVRAEVYNDIHICGFISIGDVSSPPSQSRHLVLPLQSCKSEAAAEEAKPLVLKAENGEEEEVSNEDGKQPSFCVLLHGSLKVEGMIAFCLLGGDSYGMLYSWADSKKKSNLMLSVFEPGSYVIPWLGHFSNLGSPESGSEAFPVKPSGKRSYAQNCVVWIRQSGLQADIQKILRHARKLPEKTQNFYKELNRLRRAALSFGFYELLEGMATILDRECTLLPGSAHPDAALQLTHCASALRISTREYNSPILPLRTKFSVDD